jgi:hypothetical protein
MSAALAFVGFKTGRASPAPTIMSVLLVAFGGLQLSALRGGLVARLSMHVRQAALKELKTIVGLYVKQKAWPQLRQAYSA